MTDRSRFILRFAVIAILCAMALSGATIGFLWPHVLSDITISLVTSARSMGAVGLLGFAAAVVLCAVSGVVPMALLAMSAGIIYGLVIGFLVCAAGALVGALIAFLLGRGLLRDMVARRFAEHPRLRELDRLVARDGWRIVFLLRISPVMLFSATSYALGLTGIEVRPYLLGTLACLPALLGFVVLGTLADASLTAWSGGAGPFRWIALGIGVLATLGITARIGWLAMRAGLVGAIRR